MHTLNSQAEKFELKKAKKEETETERDQNCEIFIRPAYRCTNHSISNGKINEEGAQGVTLLFPVTAGMAERSSFRKRMDGHFKQSSFENAVTAQKQ